MLDEDVDVERRHQRVAQRVLLEQEAGIGAWLNVPPRAPLVQGQPDALAWIVLVHDGGMLGNDVVDADGGRQRLGVFGLVERGRRAFPLPVVRDGVVAVSYTHLTLPTKR